jgi:hypothetical protein
LNPFPYDTTPALTCFPGTFSSVARPTFSSTPNPPFAGVTVTLDGTASTPPTGPFAWSQIVNPGDPVVAINNANSAKATFIAPTVATSQNLAFQLIVGGNGTVPASAPATLIVPITVPPPNTPPVVTATSSPVSPVASGALVTLTAAAVDPAGGAVNFVWTAPAGITLTPAAADGSVQTFTAPIVPELTAPQQLVFTVTGTSAASGLSGTATITVTVNPQTDFIQVTVATYRTKKARLDVFATDNTPGVTLTCTLDIINQATGEPISAVMGQALSAGPGQFSVIFQNVPPPNLITITSSGGGSLTTGITVLR